MTRAALQSGSLIRLTEDWLGVFHAEPNEAFRENVHQLADGCFIGNPANVLSVFFKSEENAGT